MNSLRISLRNDAIVVRRTAYIDTKLSSPPVSLRNLFTGLRTPIKILLSHVAPTLFSTRRQRVGK